LLVATGRIPNSDRLDVAAGGLVTRPDGRVVVDGQQRTSMDNVWALGDISSEYQLKHVANHEAKVVQHNLLYPDSPRYTDNSHVPSAVFTNPQIASVGLTELQARDKGHEVKLGRFPFSAIGRAQIHGEPGGFVKIVADAKTGQVLGTHIVGANATELIAEPALTQLFQGDAWELGRNIHPHPTLSEAVMKAAMAVDGHAIHM